MHVMWLVRIREKKKKSRIYINTEKVTREWHKKLKEARAVTCPFSCYAEGENPYSRNGKWKISFSATYNGGSSRAKGVNATVDRGRKRQPIKSNIFRRIRWATTRRRGFLRRDEFSTSHARSLLHFFAPLFFGADGFFLIRVSLCNTRHCYRALDTGYRGSIDRQLSMHCANSTAWL